MEPNVDDRVIYQLDRPHPDLMKYYLLGLLAVLPLAPILILPAWFRFKTLRYQFGPEGVSMRWGILFRREVIIQYARIQDIHLRTNLVERWLGLGRVLVQTASGSASAEMTLEGLKEFEAVRDFLYARMRGVKEEAGGGRRGVVAAGVNGGEGGGELVAVLKEVAEELKALREEIGGKGGVR